MKINLFQLRFFKTILLLLLSYAWSSSLLGFNDSINKLTTHEKLKFYADSLRNSLNQKVRFQANDSFIQYYEAFLDSDNSFFEDLEGINSIMIIRSPDKQIRITTWLVADNYGNYKSHGYIEKLGASKKSKKNVERYVWKLREKLEYNTKELENTDYSDQAWPGGLIYQILPFTFQKKKCYLILSYHGLGQQTNRKTIDVISFRDNEELMFGLPVFQRYKNDPDPNYRIVFNYSDQTTMTLRYDKEVDLIVFDHLVPPVEMLRGSEEFMIPDGTYGGFKRKKKGYWLRIEDFGEYKKWKAPE